MIEPIPAAPLTVAEECLGVREQLEDLLGARSERETALVARLIAGFRTKAGDLRASIGDAAAEGDTDSAARFLHTLQGAAALLGARELPLICQDLETSVRTAGSRPTVVDPDGRLAAAVDRFAALLEREGKALLEPSPGR